MRSSTSLKRLFSELRGGYLVLLDPDKPPDFERLFSQVNSRDEVRAVLVGTSFLTNDDFRGFVKKVKSYSEKPVIIFPGGWTQLAPEADGLLLLSLISGRNPEFLIGEHVRAAPHIKAMGLEAWPTAYILVESGRTTAVEFVSNTKPIPRGKVDILVAHVMAAELLGFKAVYLEAGSGAPEPVPPAMVEAARRATSLPLIVGGGIRTPEQAAVAFEAGADFVVVGTAVEEEGKLF